MWRAFLAVILCLAYLPAATIFDVSGASFAATGSPNFVGGQNSLLTTALPEFNGVTGFKMHGDYNARNTGFAPCTTCEVSAMAGGTIRVENHGETPYAGDITISWLFRVDELEFLASAPGGIGDGTSNTIIIGEQPPGSPITRIHQDIEDGTSNTLLFGELPPTRERSPDLGGIQDGTSNTILFGEGTPIDPRDFIYRLVIVYGSLPGQIQDGTSNTILIGESLSAQIVAGNGYFGDEISGSASFAFQPLLGPFTLALYVTPQTLDVERGIRLSIPESSIDLNPTPGLNGVTPVPEPGTCGLAAFVLLALGVWRRSGGMSR
ncbi:MAG: hypothetical protein KIT83_11020 [Bryobacterales bacterium]|nr:hypothetical protein [Bryobacterales bacterium]